MGVCVLEEGKLWVIDNLATRGFLGEYLDGGLVEYLPWGYLGLRCFIIGPIACNGEDVSSGGEDPLIGFVPTPKKCRTRIVLDLGVLMVPTTGLFSGSLS